MTTPTRHYDPAPSPQAATVSGLLSWGQAGNYNAIDDRSVIAALFAGGRSTGGLISPPTLTPQTGLTIAIGPWSAIVDCGDGTRAVVGARATTTIDEIAGGGSARADVLWCDVSPDAATYTISLITEAAMAGRAGAFLGLILVPASASTASAMDLRPGGARILGMRKATSPNLTITQGSWRTWAQMTIPAYDAEVGAVYEVDVWGGGQQGDPNRLELDMSCALNGAIMTSYGRFSLNALTVGMQFRQHMRGRVVCLSTGVSGTFQAAIWGSQTETGPGGPNSGISVNNGNFVHVFACDTGSNIITANTTRDITFAVQAQWYQGPGSGANIVSRQAIAGRIA